MKANQKKLEQPESYLERAESRKSVSKALLIYFQSNECIFDTQVTKKMGYYKLLEVMYVRLSKEDVHSKDSKINQAYRGSISVEGNELTKALIK